MAKPDHFRLMKHQVTCRDCIYLKVDMRKKVMVCTKHDFELPRDDSLRLCAPLERYTCNDATDFEVSCE